MVLSLDAKNILIMCSKRNALFTYDLPHRSLMSKHAISTNRARLNVLEQKNSRNVVDGMPLDELRVETDLRVSVNKNNDLVLPGSNVQAHNNLGARLGELELKSTGLLELSADNRFLIILNNDGVLLFEAGVGSGRRREGRLDLQQINVDREFLKGTERFG